jgi:hypothetical protein
MDRFEELACKLDGIDESKKPFILSLLQGFVKWEAIEQELAETKLFERTKYKGQEIVKDLPSFKMLNTATARKEDAIKSIVKLLDGEVEEESELVKALASFNKKHNDVEIR